MIDAAWNIMTVRLAIGVLITLAISAILGRPNQLASRWWLSGVRLACGIVLGVLLLSWAIPHLVITAYSFRPTPTAVKETWFDGIEYEREVRTKPLPMVIHIVTIDLDETGLAFLVTPPDPKGGMNLQGMTTSQFLERYGVQIAINGDFFEPWSDNTVLEYYPHVGDPIDVTGFAASNGIIYSQGRVNHPTMYISGDNQVSFDEPIGKVYNAISGNRLILKDGQPYDLQLTDPYHQVRHPRTAVALDKTGRKLILTLIDGRQPGYSEGATIEELIEIALAHGGFNALNLDGGGSTALIRLGSDGQPIMVNAPIHNHLPYVERPIANHLGVFVAK